ncbi:hypothetical protein ABZ085_31910, partial [Streptomyces albidoflavus]|uniref:hypothetical protein n=1 Tax=Streptomyces albidoflavus TaxID=1886 RepID=UPI0033BAC33A
MAVVRVRVFDFALVFGAASPVADVVRSAGSSGCAAGSRDGLPVALAGLPALPDLVERGRPVRARATSSLSVPGVAVRARRVRVAVAAFGSLPVLAARSGSGETAAGASV